MLIEAPGIRSDQGSRWQSQPLHLHLQPAFSLSLLSSPLKRKIKQHTMAEDKMFFSCYPPLCQHACTTVKSRNEWI